MMMHLLYYAIGFVVGLLVELFVSTRPAKSNARFWEKQSETWEKIVDEKNGNIQILTKSLASCKEKHKEHESAMKEMSKGDTVVLVDTSPLERNDKPPIRDFYKQMGYLHLADGIWVLPYQDHDEHNSHVCVVNHHAQACGYNVVTGMLRNIERMIAVLPEDGE